MIECVATTESGYSKKDTGFRTVHSLENKLTEIPYNSFSCPTLVYILAQGTLKHTDTETTFAEILIMFFRFLPLSPRPSYVIFRFLSPPPTKRTI